MASILNPKNDDLNHEELNCFIKWKLSIANLKIEI